MQITTNFDVALTVAAVMPTIAILATAWMAKRDAKRSLQQGEAIHTLVNDQLTREKAERLAVLEAQLLMLRRMDDLNPDDRALIQILHQQAKTLEREIRDRDEVAQAISEKER